MVAESRPHLLARPDCRPDIGVGHLVRCTALAEAWIRVGGRASILVDRVDEDVSELVAATAEVDVLPLEDPDDLSEVSRLADRTQAMWVVSDGYEFGSDFESSIVAVGPRLLAIDDFGHHPHAAADVVVDNNLASDPEVYRAARVLHGPRYALLRSSIRQAKTVSRPEPPGRRVLVTFGGSPTRAARSLLSGIVEQLDVDVDVIGPGFESSAEGTADRGAAFHGTIGDPGPRFRAAAVVVSAAGSTALELCHLGVPAVLVAIAGNQEAVGEALGQQGAAVYAGRAADIDPAVVVEAVTGLLEDPSRRRRLSETAAKLVDGDGAGRVVEEMLADVTPRARR